MKLDLRRLIAGEYPSMPIEFSLEPDFDANDGKSRLYGVHFNGPMSVEGKITNDAGYMRMTLLLSIDYTAPCARCLEDVVGTYSYTFEKTVALASVIENQSEDNLDEYVIVKDGFVDIDEQLLELLELTFPSKCLCSEDCKGLCSKCGKNLNEGPCDCTDKEIDPRLAPLQKILMEMKNNK